MCVFVPTTDVIAWDVYRINANTVGRRGFCIIESTRLRILKDFSALSRAAESWGMVGWCVRMLGTWWIYLWPGREICGDDERCGCFKKKLLSGNQYNMWTGWLSPTSYSRFCSYIICVLAVVPGIQECSDHPYSPLLPLTVLKNLRKWPVHTSHTPIYFNFFVFLFFFNHRAVIKCLSQVTWQYIVVKFDCLYVIEK